MQCPRDQTNLLEERVHGIEVDHCPQCNGRWLDHHQLDELEATRAKDDDHRSGMIEYAQRESELNCPVCSEPMIAFNYRAYDLELDTCEQEHGFWLDAGEEGRVRDIIDDRVRGRNRAVKAEQAWDNFLDGVGGGMWDNVRGFFSGRGR